MATAYDGQNRTHPEIMAIYAGIFFICRKADAFSAEYRSASGENLPLIVSIEPLLVNIDSKALVINDFLTYSHGAGGVCIMRCSRKLEELVVELLYEAADWGADTSEGQEYKAMAALLQPLAKALTRFEIGLKADKSVKPIRSVN